jgi:3D (Asp-Asp-Asp) domain-containing protein
MKHIIASIQAAMPTLIKRGVALGITMSLLNVSLAVAIPKTLIEGSAALGNEASASIPADAGIELARRTVSMSAYTASVDETDSTPCHTANGDDICDPNKDLTAAMNDVPFGTKIYVPALDKTFRINDRMNRRYDSNYMDIHVKTKADAFKFGRQSLEIVILD